MLDEIIQALKESNPADRYQIKRYIAWLRFRRKMHDQFYTPAHWVYAKKTPGLISQASKPLLVGKPTSAHWL